eukprot:TRINITY_DN6563_c0_g1_i1.p1 TRINITY_DN6563_c0_g1~~TRINITY_DN6563_c0_g1_i1.p1  ORF type:complete len:183 (+),score=15.27 TRINITY_DN6563_c0_g1_i1:252-800(+)
MVFYWHDALAATQIKSFNTILSRFRIPFFVCVGVLVCVEISSLIARLLTNDLSLVITIVSVIWVLVTVTILSYYVYVSKLVYQLMGQMKKSRKKSINRTTVRILASGVGMVFWLSTLCILATPITNYAVGFEVNFFFMFLLGNWVSYCQIVAFWPIKRIGQTTQESNASHNRSIDKEKGSKE